MSTLAWLFILGIFVQPMYFFARCVWAKTHGNEPDFIEYWANLKSWLLNMWDLLKWKVK